MFHYFMDWRAEDNGILTIPLVGNNLPANKQIGFSWQKERGQKGDI